MADLPSLLPPNATRFELNLEQAMARVSAIRPQVQALWNPATCPAALLPWLAWTLSVATWRSDWPEATKRAVIAASPRAHRIKGTVAAVKEAIVAVAPGQPYRLVEWFQPDGGGAPYTGFAEVDMTDVPAAGALAVAQDLVAVVAAAKPVRTRFPVRLKARLGGSVRVAAVLRRPQAYAYIAGANVLRPRIEAGLRAAAVMSRPMVVCALRGDGVVLPTFRPAVRLGALLRRPVGSAVIRGAAA